MPAHISQETTANLHSTAENSADVTFITNIQNTTETTENSEDYASLADQIKAVILQKAMDLLNIPENSTTTVALEETETAPELAQTSNTGDRIMGNLICVPVVILQKATVNVNSTAENSAGATLITNIQNTMETPENSEDNASLADHIKAVILQKTRDLINITENITTTVASKETQTAPEQQKTTVNVNNTAENVATNIIDTSDEPRTPIDKKNRDTTQAVDKAGTSLENDVTPKKSSAQHEASMQNQFKKHPLVAKDELSQNKEKYRFFVETCMEELVKRVIKKSGKVISPERVLTIYKRLSEKIWAKIRDEIDQIPLRKFKNFEKVIFKALCKQWQEAEVVLQNMELNEPTVDNTIVKIFIEEAAKLSKKPSCIRRFFSSIGRLFCFTRRQNKVDAL
ncbi:uncharacterized protein LOC113016716 [Astatotilapia calliptera]|uniref:uncharacterized protein LOC113016716 n=1 Tax=Astatotilapia calliptera TaxID=8154 RepID=UPI000E411D92|nr:uncharacterized protein LOC113016716 [Astatotilapia calliptera]XP_026015557.1 uncharacterized protein LOC113016716 [Astatotilapia calliptera]